MPAVPANVMRWGVPALLAAAIVAALLFMLASQFGGNYRPLFGARENVVVADVVGVLDAEGVRYRLHPDSGQVLVADGDLGRARMLLASKGVVAKLPEGLELMDRNDPLGVSQFVQDVRFRRGLEGELARSIGTLDAVQSARVHLSIARSSSFVVNTGDKSSASVVLQMKPGQQLKREQIAAIVHMVSSSVSGLDPQRVALTDQAGNFLSARVDLSEGFDPQSQDDAANRVSEDLRRNAQELLTAAVGAGHFRITVTADVSQDHSEETYEQFSGDPKVLSEATREEKDRNAGVALGVPGSLSNRPINVDEDKAGAGKDANGNFRAALSRNYAYDRSVVKVKRGKGRINKLFVAVVLDDSAAPGEATTWSEQELARMDKLLRAALGVDSVRGDLLQVSSMAFTPMEVPKTWWQEPGNWLDLAITVLWVVAGVVLLVLLWRVVNAWSRSVKTASAQAPGASQPALADASPSEAASNGASTLALGAQKDATAAAGGAPALPFTTVAGGDSKGMSMEPLLENVDLPPPGSQVDVMVEHLRSLAAKEPERVAEVVKQWVQKHGQPVANQQ